MGKIAVKSKTTKTGAGAQRYLSVIDIQQKFIGEAFGLGWRLVVAFIVPVAIGIWVDKEKSTKPAYTLVGVFIALVVSVLIIQRTVKGVNADLNQQLRKGNKRG
jgi:F0F1-type ATP synthase assembly protein I